MRFIEFPFTANLQKLLQLDVVFDDHEVALGIVGNVLAGGWGVCGVDANRQAPSARVVCILEHVSNTIQTLS